MGFRFQATVAGLLLLAARAFPQAEGPAGSAAEEPPKAVIFIVPRPLGGEQDAPFLPILAEALQIDLNRAGLEARLPDKLSLPDLAAAPIGRLLEEAADADFLIMEGYTSRDQRIQLEVKVLRVADGQAIASATSSRRIDLRLDEAVSEVVEQLMPQLQPHLAEAVFRRQQAAEAEPPETVALGEQPPVEAAGLPQEPPVPEEVPEEVAEGEAAQERSPAAPEAQSGIEPAREPERRLEVGAGGAVFFPLAELHQLFQIGYGGEVYLDYRLRNSIASLSLGLYAGYAGLLPTEEGTASFFHALVPFGLELRLGTPARLRLGAHLRVQAGGMLNASSQSKVDQRLTRVLPQLKAGAGLSLAISPRLGISLELLYELLLYAYMVDGKLAAEPIMGFDAPAIYIYTLW